ncbi:MAG: phosphotransferase [Myxococcales bacterium]|nr:phosphotransferase [Myxococcales bacterium]
MDVERRGRPDPMTPPWELLAARLGGRFVRERRLLGGVSAQVHALDLEDPVRTVVVRHQPADAVQAEGVALEHALLERLVDLPVARPLLLDLSGDVLPGPLLVLPFVQGASEPADRLEGAAAMGRFLRALHALDPDSLGLPALPTRDDPRRELPGFLPERPDLARVRWSPAPRRLLHGDLWPGNVLWRGDELAVVLDWEDAAVGDPVSDVAVARCELHAVWSPEAAERLLQAYGPVDPARLALWDAYVSSAALANMDHWGLPLDVLHRRRTQTRAFLASALRGLR